MLPSLSLEGKVALVAGGSRGIGRATALTFAEAGANLAICARNLAPLEETSESIRALGRRCLPLVADVSVKSDVDQMVQKTIEEFGTVDILFNNAYKLIVKQFVDLPEDDWNSVIDICLKGYYFCSQVVGRVMMKNRKGNIINVSSDAAIQAWPGWGVYSIAKVGVVNMTRSLANELGPYNIRVNGIAPSMVRTESNKRILSNPKLLKEIEDKLPLRRIAEENEMSAIALFLASDASSCITGQTIYTQIAS